MLLVRMSINGHHKAGDIKIVRSWPHLRLRRHFWYNYEAYDDNNNRYVGKVLHNYDNGPFALVQKVTKEIVASKKLAKLKDKEGINND